MSPYSVIAASATEIDSSGRDRVDLDGLKKLGDYEEMNLEQIFPY